MRKNIDQILTKAGYLYLILPFFIFVVGTLNIPSAGFFAAIILASTFYCLKNIENNPEISNLFFESKKIWVWTLIIISIILFFSGIGSFTYQNSDFLYRNAIFRDLVKNSWPVLYKVKGFEGNALEGKTAMMTYYYGYFLPSVLVGKIFGFKAGQFALFLWSILGAILVIFQMGKFFKRFNYKVLLLLFGWGTLYFIGSFYKFAASEIFNETSYLWAGMRLYCDSNLGLIYWTFNQSFTSWLVILFLFNNESKKNIFFTYALCFFLSPFAFLGLFPFVIHSIYTNFEGGFSKAKDWILNFKKYLSFQNIAGAGAVILLNYLFISTNKAGKTFGILENPSFKIFVVFFLLSWLIIGALIFKKYKKDSLYWLVILVLFPLPFFQLSHGIDFPGRVSIPAMFILMLLVGKFLIEEKKGILKTAVHIYLGIALVGHFSLEMGRSMVFTAFENISNKTNIDEYLLTSNNPSIQNIGQKLKESKGKDTLLKDYGTLINPKNEIIVHYIADIEGSVFYKYFAKKQ